MSDRASTTIIYIVTAMWAGNILAGMFSLNGYQPSEAVNGIFMVVVGGAFVARHTKRNGGDGE